jgi:hypothetical protein
MVAVAAATLPSHPLPYSILSSVPHCALYCSLLYCRISATLKARWEDPEFREKMLTRSFERTDEWRALVSDRIRAKWSDPEYRAAVAVGTVYYNGMSCIVVLLSCAKQCTALHCSTA